MAITTQSESRARLEALRQLLEEGAVGTQEEICDALEKKKFSVTQSTISRDLRRIGAVKAISQDGNIVYRLPEEQLLLPPNVSNSIRGLLLDIQHNGSMIVIHTPPGSASLVAHHLDSVLKKGILGTLAGDDTIFIAPVSTKSIEVTMKQIVDELG
jgi:transcriptional regulator of arginine metabolism